MDVPPAAVETGGRLARRRRERQRRRRARRRLALRGLTAAAATSVVIAAAAATTVIVGGGDAARPEGDVGAQPAGGAAPEAEQDTLLLVRTGQDGAARSVTLLAAGERRATAVLIPTGTLVTVPGVGTDRLALAGQYGGPALVRASVENLLGITVDHVAAVDGPAMGAWLDRVGGLELDVPPALGADTSGTDGAASLEPGRRTLDGAQLAAYWALAGEGSELSSLARQEQVLSALLARLGEPEAAGALSGGEGATPDTDASAGWMRRLLSRAGRAHDRDAAELRVLPVERVGGEASEGGRGPAYRTRPEEVQRLRRQRLAASVPDRAVDGRVRMQVLNGVGRPGIGRAVEQRLGGGRVELVATANARTFDQATTRIVVYDDDAATREAAEWVRRRLGVGTIQMSQQPQSVVDVTVIVGADFQA